MMTWTVYSNPVADMYGPDFLLFYLVYSVFLMLLVFRLRKRNYQAYAALSSSSLMSLKRIDPYYVAWLKGGIDNVLKLAMMRLSYEGLLTAGGNKGKTFIRPQITDQELFNSKEQKLSPLERLVLFRFEAGYDQKKNWAFNSLRSLYQDFNLKAQQEGYAYPDNCQRKNKLIAWVGFILTLGLGLYKFNIALINGHHNVVLLLIMMLVLTLIYWIGFLRSRNISVKLTPKGEKLIKRLSATIPKDRKSLKQLDIAMVAVALDEDGSVYSRCAFGNQAYVLGLIYPISSAAAGSSFSNNSGSGSDSSSDSGSSGGCSGCGGCGGGGD